MKLIKIELENLNSLYGKHSIDFEKDLLGAPLFLIMGSTGAGKSTIMDAMSLALFGQTPRLTKGKTDKDPENDCRQIMSRGTVAAFSQLVFSKLENGKIKKYRATWQCERAYKKSDGNFKDPRRILEYFNPEQNDWEQITSDHRPKFYELHFNKVLENLTVEDFKRMVLLAQGEFAAFLKANEEERAAILERLTNTEIYKDIGKKAAEKKKFFEEKLNEVNIRLNGISLLTIAEEQELLAEISRLEMQIQDFNHQINLLNKNIDWIDKEKNLLEKFREAELNFNQYEKKYLENSENILKLDRYNKFSHAIQLIIKEENCKKDILERELAMKECANEIVEIKSHIHFINNNIKQFHKAFETAKNTLNEKKLEIDKAKSLRIIKNSLNEEISDKNKKISNLELEKQKITAIRNHLDKQIIDANRSKNELQDLIKLELSNLLISYKFFSNIFEKLKRDFEFLKRELITISIPYETPKEKLNYLRSTRDKFIEEKNLLSKALFHIEDLQKREEEILQLEKRHELVNQEFIDANTNFLSKKEILNNEMNDIFTIKDHVSNLSWRIELAQRREHLNSGEECPLCGSKEHPYFQEMSFKSADLEAVEKHDFLLLQLNNKELFQNNTMIGLSEIEKNIFSYTQEMKTIKSQIDSLNLLIIEKKNKINSIFKNSESININADSNHFYLILARTDDLNNENLSNIDREIRFLSDKIDNYNIVKDKYIEIKEKDNKYLKNKQELNDTLIYLDQNFKLENFEEKLNYNLLNEIEIIFEDKRYFDKCRSIENNFSQFSHKKIEIEKEFLILDKNITDLKLEKNVTNSRLECISKDILYILNGEEPQVFEKKLNDIVFEKQEKLQNEQKILNEKEKQFAVLHNQFEHFSHQHFQLKEKFSLVSNLLSNELSLLGSCSKDEIIKFDLSEESLRAYQILNNELERLKISTLEVKLQRENDLIAHRNLDCGQSNRMNLDLLLSNREHFLNNLNYTKEMKSQIIAKILNNDENKNKSYKVHQDLKSIQKEYLVWQKLHQIIGINNGDQFKKFAQILNLEELIAKANYHLSRFEKRYSLAPALDAESRPRLAFAIKDSYHANELRSFKTLSGGETFLVSLALALALADYRTVKMPIETILLDEGFGTLDPATLQIAMGALESLHSNGTQVGIISHVESLKEAIRARIIVEKQGNGHSNIKIENL